MGSAASAPGGNANPNDTSIGADPASAQKQAVRDDVVAQAQQQGA